MKKPSWSFLWWSVLAAVYIIVSYLQPISKNQLAQYHLSEPAIHGIDASIIVPILIILYFAYVGYINLRRYYLRIISSPDGQAFKSIAAGLGVFAYGTLGTSIISSVVRWIADDHHGFTADSTRITNYTSMLVPLIAFWFIAVGVGKLVKVGKIKFNDLPIKTALLVIVLLATSYAFVVYHQDQGISALTGNKIFFMPDWLVLFTIIVPYVFAWALGFLSVIQMITYQRKVKGMVYKRNLSLLSNGLGIILIAYILIEYLTSLANHYILHQISWLLVIVYILLIIAGVGYLMMATGARRLKKIEDV